MQNQVQLWLQTEMNHEPSQFCGPLTRRGATFNVPLPQSAHAIRHVSEWTHCVWMSGLNAEEPGSSPPTRRSPLPPSDGRGRHPLLPGGRGQESDCACRMCKREWGRMSCVFAWLRAWLGSVRDWVRTHAETGEKKDTNNIWRESKMCKCATARGATMTLAEVSGKRNSAFERGQFLRSLKGRILDMRKKKKRRKNHRHVDFFWFWIVKLVLIDTGHC